MGLLLLLAKLLRAIPSESNRILRFLESLPIIGHEKSEELGPFILQNHLYDKDNIYSNQYSGSLEEVSIYVEELAKTVKSLILSNRVQHGFSVKSVDIKYQLFHLPMAEVGVIQIVRNLMGQRAWSDMFPFIVARIEVDYYWLIHSELTSPREYVTMDKKIVLYHNDGQKIEGEVINETRNIGI